MTAHESSRSYDFTITPAGGDEFSSYFPFTVSFDPGIETLVPMADIQSAVENFAAAVAAITSGTPNAEPAYDWSSLKISGGTIVRKIETTEYYTP